MVTIRRALDTVKDGYARFVDGGVVLRICERIGYRFRQRELGPAGTLVLFLVQVLHGNTACSHLRHLAGMSCGDSAYCRARMRLPLALFRAMLRWVCESLSAVTETASRWHGHRVVHVDGSSFSMPDTPALQKAFGQPGGQKAGCGFPVARLLAVVDAATGAILDVLAAPLRTHEMSRVRELLRALRPGDLLVADRGFCSYAHLALVFMQNMHAVFRIHQKTIVDFTPGRPHVRPSNHKAVKGLPRSEWLAGLGATDQIVRWFKPTQKPTWITRDEYDRLPDSLTVRELAYRVETPGYRTQTITLVTTLLDASRYPAEELAELYRCRWQIEVNLRHLKQTMGMDVLRCETPDGVLKEMLMFAMAYNLVCLVIFHAADRQGVPPDRISFVDALRWLRTWQPGKILIDLLTNPRRPGRFEPRVVKRRPKQYKLMTAPRATLRNRLLNQSPTS